MNDLKIILYVVAAIVWVVYNNYRKISEASRKRDFRKPAGETSREVPAPPVRNVREVVEKQPRKMTREVMKRKPVLTHIPVSKYSRKPESHDFIKTSFNTEGGSISPSKTVTFQSASESLSHRNYLLESLRSMNLRNAFIMSEILKRPNY